MLHVAIYIYIIQGKICLNQAKREGTVEFLTMRHIA